MNVFFSGSNHYSYIYLFTLIIKGENRGEVGGELHVSFLLPFKVNVLLP